MSTALLASLGSSFARLEIDMFRLCADLERPASFGPDQHPAMYRRSKASVLRRVAAQASEETGANLDVSGLAGRWGAYVAWRSMNASITMRRVEKFSCRSNLDGQKALARMSIAGSKDSCLHLPCEASAGSRIKLAS